MADQDICGRSQEPRFESKLASVKTTDLLSIRAIDGAGIGFFDALSDVAARKAAWFSAATILQRAVALELDVDSLAVEIASVHRYSAAQADGAELYLADEHPNGAGLVDWLRRNWEEVVAGCLTGKGSYSTLGRFMVEELSRGSSSEQWRSPIYCSGLRIDSCMGY